MTFRSSDPYQTSIRNFGKSLPVRQSVCCSHSTCTEYTNDPSGRCPGHRNLPTTWNVEVSVSGGVTGHRVSLLKDGDGRAKRFDYAAAEAEAARYRREMNGPHATATFSARVVPVVDEDAR